MSKYRDTDEILEQIRKKLGIKSLDYLLEAERQIVDAIQSVPIIDIESKRGEWIPIGVKRSVFECSECGTIKRLNSNFCPNCGAKMKGSDDEYDK